MDPVGWHLSAIGSAGWWWGPMRSRGFRGIRVQRLPGVGEQDNGNVRDGFGGAHFLDGCRESEEMSSHSAVEVRVGPVGGDDGVSLARHLADLRGEAFEDALAVWAADAAEDACSPGCLIHREGEEVKWRGGAGPKWAQGRPILVRRRPCVSSSRVGWF